MLPFLALASTFAVPGVAVVASLVWARWLQKRPATPSFAAWVGYGLALASTAMLVVGFLYGARVFRHLDAADPTEKARALAEGISEAMNASAFGLLLAVTALAWLLVFTLLTRKKKA